MPHNHHIAHLCRPRTRRELRMKGASVAFLLLAFSARRHPNPLGFELRATLVGARVSSESHALVMVEAAASSRQRFDALRVDSRNTLDEPFII